MFVILFRSQVYPEFGISKQDVRYYPPPSIKENADSMKQILSSAPMDFTSINSQSVQVPAVPLESPRYYVVFVY